MTSKKILVLVLCILSLVIIAPFIVYKDYKQPTHTENILIKKETVDKYGEPRYYLILEQTGSMLVTPKAYYTHEKGQTFSYNLEQEEVGLKYANFYFMVILISSALGGAIALFMIVREG